MNAAYQFGIIGYPIGHSLSPVMHQAFMQQAGVQGQYTPFAVSPADLPQWLRSDVALALDGFNVTIPHKVAVIEAVDSCSDDVLAIGAANTIKRIGKQWFAYNTDCEGFLYPLRKKKPDLDGANVMIMGHGGASRSVVWALLNLKPMQITLVLRNPDQIEATYRWMQAMVDMHPENPLTHVFVTATLPDTDLWQVTNLLVNATPVGMSPHVNQLPVPEWTIDALPETALVYDLVYNPIQTNLVLKAQHRGLQTQDGLTMLVMQGVRAFELWTERTLDLNVVNATRAMLTAQLVLDSTATGQSAAGGGEIPTRPL